jgi:hypothetical protein
MTARTVIDLDCAIVDALSTISALGDLLTVAGVSEVELNERASLSRIGALLCREASRIGEAADQLASLARRRQGAP